MTVNPEKLKYLEKQHLQRRAANLDSSVLESFIQEIKNTFDEND